MASKCMCLGCGREFCGVGYMGSRVCGGKLRKKGWAMSGGHCTSCVCGECGAAGRACPPSCQWAFGPPPPPPASQGPGLAASSNQPSPWAAAAAKAAPAWELVAWEAPAALPALPAPSAKCNEREAERIKDTCETKGCCRQKQYPYGCAWDRCCKQCHDDDPNSHTPECNEREAERMDLDGHRTLPIFSSKLVWSFQAIWKGKHPETDSNGCLWILQNDLDFGSDYYGFHGVRCATDECASISGTSDLEIS